MEIKSHPHATGVATTQVDEIAYLTLTYVGTYPSDAILGSKDTG